MCHASYLGPVSWNIVGRQYTVLMLPSGIIGSAFVLLNSYIIPCSMQNQLSAKTKAWINRVVHCAEQLYGVQGV